MLKISRSAYLVSSHLGLPSNWKYLIFSITAVTFGVVVSIALSPFLAGFAVCVGVPLLLCYVYGVVPIALCRSEGCGVTTSSSWVKIDIDEDPPYRYVDFIKILRESTWNKSSKKWGGKIAILDYIICG